MIDYIIDKKAKEIAKEKENIIDSAEKLCKLFVSKVESGRARSKETYAVCKELLEKIKNVRKEEWTFNP